MTVIHAPFTTYDHADTSSKRITSVLDIGENRQLHIVTRKEAFSGNLVTWATVQEAKDGMLHYLPFSDYGKQLENNHTRVTAKAIRFQHNRNMEQASNLIQEAKAHYTKETPQLV
jgi:hypothetical protein